MNIMQNNGAAAGQTVFHYHVHIIPRWQDDGVVQFWEHKSLSQAEFAEIVAKISQAL
jgi:histidine triad (HIT) family protein